MSELESFVSETDDVVAEEQLDTSEAETPAEQPVEAEQAASEEKGEIETEEPPSSEQAEDESDTQQSESDRGLLAAKQAEKEKRQKAERELAELRAMIEQSQSQQQKPEQEKKDIWDDPEGYINNLRIEMRAELSEALAKQKYDDYDSVMDHYGTMVKANPHIHAQVLQDPMSAMKAYEIAKNDLELKEIGNVSEFRTKSEQRIQELEAQLEQLQEQAKKSNVPPDLTTARSAGSDPQRPDEIPDGDAGLEMLLNR